MEMSNLVKPGMASLSSVWWEPSTETHRDRKCSVQIAENVVKRSKVIWRVRGCSHTPAGSNPPTVASGTAVRENKSEDVSFFSFLSFLSTVVVEKVRSERSALSPAQRASSSGTSCVSAANAGSWAGSRGSERRRSSTRLVSKAAVRLNTTQGIQL